jgi:hypothetical protein
LVNITARYQILASYPCPGASGFEHIWVLAHFW